MANKGSCRLSLSVGLRDYYTSKLTIAFIAHDSGHNIAVKNQAKQIERDVYKMAHSRREYYHLIAENVDKIQKSFKQQQQVLQQPTVHQKALRQLMSTLRSPTSHNQQQEMLQILESNPRLMAAFIIYRQINANLDAIASGTKQWHNRVTKYWRPYSTDKLVEDLFPGGDSNNEGVRLFAEAVEENAYLTAKTRGDYYRMFYETINKIKKILAEQSNF